MILKDLEIEDTEPGEPVIYTVRISGAILYRHAQKDKLIIEVRGHVVGEISRLAVSSGLIDLDELGHYMPSNPDDVLEA